jgi:hypothetical protein
LVGWLVGGGSSSKEQLNQAGRERKPKVAKTQKKKWKNHWLINGHHNFQTSK